MKRLLMIAPAFPPHPSASGHRWRFVSRYAAARGWECDVLTVEERQHAEPMDEGLRRLVAPELRIHSVGAIPREVARRFGLGDIALRAFLPMRRMLGRMISAQRPSMIYIPGPPFYQFLLGPWALKKFGVPYVVDYTDPWAPQLKPGQDRPWKKIYWARKLALWLEPSTVRHAAHVFAVSDGTNAEIRARYPDIPADHFSAVPFGFEPNDYDVVRAHPRPNRYWQNETGLVHLVYVGAMLPHGYETLRALFSAVRDLRARQPELGERLRLHFFGTTYDPAAPQPLVLPTAREMGLGDIVTEHPRRIPYLDALSVLTAADVVLALGSSEKHYTASKIFPILLSGRPVFAAYHEASSVCDIVRKSGVGELVTYSDHERAEDRVAAFSAALSRALSSRAAASQRPRLDGLSKYSAEATTGHIFQVMSGLVEAPASSAEALAAGV